MEQKTVATEKPGFNWAKFFFWFGYAILLLASIPHAAYILAAYTDLSQIEWGISYLGAGLIEVSIYVSTYAIYKILKMGINWSRAFAIAGLLLWNIVCTGISWMLNTQHAAHFHHADMLTGTQGIPLQSFTIYLASIWPVLGIIFTLVSRIVTQRVEEIGTVKIDNRSPEQIKKEAALERARMIEETKNQIVRSRLSARKRSSLISANVGGVVGSLRQGIQHGIKGEQDIDEDFSDLDNLNITVEEEVEEQKLLISEPKQNEAVEVQEPQPIQLLTNEDKLALALQAYQDYPNITDEQMGRLLGIENPNKAHFWVLKAQEAANHSQEAREQLSNEAHLANVPEQDDLIEEKTNNFEELVPVEEEEVLVASNGHSVQFATAQAITLPPVETKKPKEAYYKIIEGEHVKYSSARPFFDIDGSTFASIGSAYQKRHSQNVYRDDLADEKITYKNLYTLIKDQKIAREYVRLVRTRRPFGKSGDAYAMCIAIHPQVRDHILGLLV